MTEIGSLIGTSKLELCAFGRTHTVTILVTHPLPDRPAAPVTLPPLIGAVASEMNNRVSRVTVMFIADDSGSMYGRYADHTGIRYAAAQSVVNLMERSGGGRAGVIHWGTDAPMALALRPTDVKRGKKALKSALVVPKTLGGNDLPRALRRAAELTPSLVADETILYYVITDGCESVTPAMHEAIAALRPGSVHMLLVDPCRYCDDALEADWITCTFGSFTRLNTFDTKEMAMQIGQIFANSIGLKLPVPTTTSGRK